MEISYKKLWKLLIDRDLKKKDLELQAGISHYTTVKDSLILLTDITRTLLFVMKNFFVLSLTC